jgi:APA family basic amino acid/polyamine antiporter
MGFAGVGADIFLSLGLIAAFAHGWMPLAILLAAVIYVATGLAYAELASAIPVSGGSAVFGKRAFGPLVGFLGGWGLMMDYLIDVVLFTVAAVGYLGIFFPVVKANPALSVSLFVALLVALNLLGIRESSRVSAAFTVFTIGIIFAVLLAGFSGAFSLDRFTSQLTPIFVDPGQRDFLYALTLAMVTFIGIEEISQLAEETRDPKRIIPRAAKMAVGSVVFFALVVAVMSLGVVNHADLAAHVDNPLTAVALALPFSGVLVPLVAIAGFVICLASANTGVVGSSRVSFALAREGLFSRKLAWVHPRFRTPWVTLVLFSLLAVGLAWTADIFLLGELYAFGALTAYLVTNLSLIGLRVKEPNLERPYRVPLNVRVRGRDIPLVSVVGVLGILTMFGLMLWLHEEGRLVAGAWFGFGVLFFFGYRAYKESAPEREVEEHAHAGKALVVPVRLLSEESDLVDYAATLARRGRYAVHLLHVVTLPPTLPIRKGFVIGLGDADRTLLKRLKETLEKHRFPVRALAMNARTWDEGLLAYLEEHHEAQMVLLRETASPEAKQVLAQSPVQVVAFEDAA